MADSDIKNKIGECIKALNPDHVADSEDAGLDIIEIVDKEDESQIEQIIEALKDEVEEVRKGVAEVLGEIGGKLAVEPLIKVLRDEHEIGMAGGEVYRKVIPALEKIGDKRAVKVLIEVLKNDKWQMRRLAIIALRSMGDKQVVRPLVEVLGDDEKTVRRLALLALKEFGEDSVEPLIEALKDKRLKVRGGAAEILGKIGGVGAVEPLTTALKNSNEEEKTLRKIKTALLNIERRTKSSSP